MNNIYQLMNWVENNRRIAALIVLYAQVVILFDALHVREPEITSRAGEVGWRKDSVKLPRPLLPCRTRFFAQLLKRPINSASGGRRFRIFDLDPGFRRTRAIN
jgi:hypothetical protein